MPEFKLSRGLYIMQGYDDAKKGKLLEECPYKAVPGEESNLQGLWIAGWRWYKRTCPPTWS